LKVVNVRLTLPSILLIALLLAFLVFDHQNVELVWLLKVGMPLMFDGRTPQSFYLLHKIPMPLIITKFIPPIFLLEELLPLLSKKRSKYNYFANVPV
jgi:hypothetical protein